MSSVVAGLSVDGKLVALGASGEPIEVPTLSLIGARRSIVGWPSGTAPDSEDTLKFSVQSNVRPLIETFPLAKAADAYQHMMSGKARFRVVLIA
jgi:D-arabinose 1-dehydrogenase-like Zn-dependent alcohol dehydrogenase